MAKQEEVIKTFDLEVVSHRVVQHLGDVYRETLAGIKQYGENSRDALAKHIVFIFERESEETLRLIICDDGHGMTPYILPEGFTLLNQYYSLMEQRAISPNADIREYVPEHVYKSMQWMTTHIGDSWKRWEKTLAGEKGIGGSASWTSFGESIEFYSRPTDRLAEPYLLAEGLTSIPTWVCRPPSKKNLSAKDRVQILKTQEPLFGVLPQKYAEAFSDWGSFTHGTRVEISGIPMSLLEKLKAQRVVNALQQKFGYRIRNNEIQIVLVDSVTQDKPRKGRTYIVPPNEYLGIPLIEGGEFKIQIRQPDGSTVDSPPISVNLFYDSKPNPLYPYINVLIAGDTACQLRDLEDFDIFPFNHPNVFGSIETPGGVEGFWRTDKHGITNSFEGKQWKEYVWGLKQELEDQLKKIEQNKKNSARDELKKDLLSVLPDVLKKNPVFKNAVLPSFKQSGTKRTRGDRKPPITPVDVSARVVDQNGGGIRGVHVLLFRLKGRREEQIDETLRTKESGTVSFGQQSFGDYIIRIIPPSDIIVPKESCEVRFTLNPNRQWFEATFTISLEHPKQKTKQITDNIELLFEVFTTDTTLAWRDDLDMGAVIVNKTHPTLVQARLYEDNDRELHHLAACIAMCTAFHCLEGTPEWVAQNGQDLIYPLYLAARQKNVGRRKASTTSKNR